MKTSANVASVITAAREAYATTGVDYIRFKVRAVKDGVAGAESELTLDISVMQKTRSTLKDFADINWQWLSNGKATTGTGANPDDMWYDSSYQNGVGWLYGDNSATYQVGQYFTFSFRMDIHRNAGFAAPVFATSLMSQKDKLGYWLTVWEDGTVGLNRGKDWDGVNSNSAFKLGSLLYECPQLLPAIEKDVKYFVTFGIDEVYDLEGTKVTDRIIVRISKEVGLDREMLGVMEYDALDEIAFPTNYITYAQFWLNGQDTATGTSRTVVGSAGASMKYEERYYDLTIVVQGEIVGKRTLTYGEEFDLSEYLEDIPAGYNVIGWRYSVDDTAFLPCNTLGYLNVCSSGLVEAVIGKIDYTVSYTIDTTGALSGVTNAAANPMTYTVEDGSSLVAPENIPNGYVFKGWYEADNPQNRVDSLVGYAKDLQLVASIVRGYAITIVTEELQSLETVVCEESAGDFTLSAPEITGKTFVKWQVLSDGVYLDYTGATTFAPVDDMTFKAVYSFIEYTITYEAEGATHSNPATYTAEQVVALTPAQKEDAYFVGWYADVEYTKLVENTAELKENVTLYARFTEDTLPTTITYYVRDVIQKIPVPVLPEDFSYTVELYKSGVAEKEVLIEELFYVFDLEESYTLKYVITLPTGRTENREVTLTVAVQTVFTVTVHYGDNQTLTITKNAGEKLTKEELPAVAQGYTFAGVYKDEAFTKVFDLNNVISTDMDIYVKWNEEEDNGVGASCASEISAGELLALMSVLGAALLLRKRKFF